MIHRKGNEYENYLFLVISFPLPLLEALVLETRIPPASRIIGALVALQ